MAGRATVFLTPEETQRVTQKFEHGTAQRKTRAGEAWKAEDRKGLIQHATSTSLMQELSLASLGFGGAAPQKKSEDTMMTYAVGAAYPPCTVDAADLAPMKIAELQLESHHRGKKLTVRRVSPVAELKVSSWAVVEGVGEDASQVVVLETFLHKQRMGKDRLDSGSEFIVKEPYYTLNGDNEAVVRINHPSDLVIATVSEDPESWRDNYKVEDPAVTPEQCKEKGNAALSKQRHSLAHAYYTRGIAAADAAADPASTLPQDLRRNRAHVNLVLQRYDEAKSDALSSLTQGASAEQQSLDAKAYYRAGSAAYALGDFAEAKRCFAEQDRLQPDSKTRQINIRRTAKRLEEQEKRRVDMDKIVASLPKVNWKPDVAGFDGDTAIKSSPGAGRGLFATRDFKAGEVIMCEKAFCAVSSRDKGSATAVTALTVDLDDAYNIRVFPAGLHRAVVQKLLDNPSSAPRILALDSGSWAGTGDACVLTADGPVVDAFQVHNIVQRNAFGLAPQTDDEDVTSATTGLWERACYINHSCRANATKEFAGDVVALRAARAIAAGEEISHAYDDNGDYDARRALLHKTWGFACRCELCAAEGQDGDEVRARRRALLKEANEFAQSNNPSGARIIAMTKAKRLRKALDDTYDEKRFKNLPRLATNVIDHWLMLAQR